METLEQFKTENTDWLESVISDYTVEMKFDEGINNHSSDYFTDTLFVCHEKCQNEELALEVKAYIESEIIKRLR
jgi:hypothetical protein